jgi:hypothetical protein
MRVIFKLILLLQKDKLNGIKSHTKPKRVKCVLSACPVNVDSIGLEVGTSLTLAGETLSGFRASGNFGVNFHPTKCRIISITWDSPIHLVAHAGSWDRTIVGSIN